MLRFVSYDAANQPHISYQREYTLKDHLGNLRLAYRAGQVRTLLAGLELNQPAVHQREAQQFDSLSVSAPVAQNVGGLAYSGTYVAKLNAGGSSPQPLGPLTQLGVQQGDTVTVTAFGYYQQPVQHGFFFTLGSFLAGLFHPAQAPPPGFEASKRKDLPLLQVGVAAGLASIPQLSGGVPKGYLRVLVFDKDSALVSQQTQQLSQAARGGYEPLRLQVRLPQDGYVGAYVGNESDVGVLFDDVQLEHRPGLQVQETQYDPAGLELAGLAPPSPGIKGLNNYRFNGKEFQPDLGLAWNHQDWRFFDPQLLRWHAGDPKIEADQESWSPYSFGYDNAVRYADADGQCPLCITAAIGAAVGAGISAGVAIYEGKDTKDVLIAAAGGAVAGAIAGTGAGLIEEIGLGVGHAIAVNAATGFVGGAAQEVVGQVGAKARDSGAEFNTAKIAQSAIIGTVSNVFGGLVTDPLKKGVAKIVGTRVAAQLTASTASQEARQGLSSTLQKAAPALRNNNRVTMK